ncbi:hypothetical protein U0070_002636, partial [Myodes glareolus]
MLSAPENLSEEEQDELRRELAKVEEEIQTLSQVLAAKEKHLAEIKRKLGISSLQEFKQNIAKGWQDVTATSAYVPLVYTLLDDVKDAFAPFLWGEEEEGHEDKTSETLSQAGQKASAAFSSVGSVITKKLEDVNRFVVFLCSIYRHDWNSANMDNMAYVGSASVGKESEMPAAATHLCEMSVRERMLMPCWM